MPNVFLHYLLKILSNYSLFTYISLAYPPELVHTFISQTVHPGSSLSLKCSAVGNPLPAITWFIDETTVSLLNDNNYYEQRNNRISVGSYKLHASETVSFLNISNAEVEDSGVYKCQASNLAGSTYHSSRLNIYGRIFVKEMKRLTLVAGESAVISCPYGGFPVDKIIWQKDSQDVTALMKSISSRFKVLSNGSLQISGVNRDNDSGRYACVVSNRRGEVASEFVDVNVMSKKKTRILLMIF